MKKFSGILFALVLVVSLTLVPAFADNGGAADTDSDACTDILVGKDATVDGSTIITYSCDGARYAKINHVPGETFPPGTMMPIYYRPYVGNYADYIYWLDKEVLKGEIPQVEETYAYNEIQVWLDEQRVGGINEYGLVTGETTIGGERVLRNSEGLLYAYSNYKESSLLVLALQRCKTARDAVQVMGDLACDYGYAQTGEHISVTDGNESWAFEIFGPGPNWPESGQGAVWCAYRIPDGEIGISCNRSRIGLIDDDNPDYEFLHSDNVYTLAESLDLWDPDEDFVWCEVYGRRSSLESSTREWVVMDLLAPSQGFVEGGELPLTFVPDEPVSVQDIQFIYRYYFEGTDRDPTENPAFYYEYHGEMVKSPMASPWGPRDLHTLLGIPRERVPATTSSAFAFIAQVRADLPDPIKGCLWFCLCPPASSCYIPVYSGATELPESWGNTDLCKINRDNAFWAFHLVDQLAVIKYQSTIQDIKGVRDPAEATFFAQQPDFEKAVVKVFRHPKGGQAAAEELVTDYTNACMNAASDGYWELVDYMLFTYFFRASSGAPQELPTIDCPPVPKGK